MLYKTKEHKNREKKLSPVKDPSHLFYSSKVLPVECYANCPCLPLPYIKTLEIYPGDPKFGHQTPDITTKASLPASKVH